MGARLSRYLACAVPILLGLSAPAFAQINSGPVVPATAPEQPRGPAPDYSAERPDTGYGPPPPVDKCDEDQEAAQITGEIVVCRRIREQEEFRIRNSDRAESDYARETMYEGDPQAPDVAGPGIFRGKATVSGMCFVPPCPTPVMPDIDFAAIPEAPPGSDADRVGRGLPPRGIDGPVVEDGDVAEEQTEPRVPQSD